jgi:HAD superfamily hydrolase (TIGR01509 family)
VAVRRGTPITYETFLSCFGRVNDDCIRVMFGDGVPREESLAIADAKEAAFRSIIAAAVPLAPGLKALLDMLAGRGVLLAVGSSAPPENVALVLDNGGIRQWFRAIVDGSMVTRGKPAPDVFLAAARALGVTPADCAVIEDAPAGIQAAVAAGMLAIGVTTTHSAEQLKTAGAHVIFETPARIPPEFWAGTVI